MKFKLIKQCIKDEEADQVIDLANWGMSRKLIASEVYGTQGNGEATHSSLMRVNHILATWDVRVTDYRNGKNKYGRSIIPAIRREADVLESIRVAAKEVTTRMSKTG